MPIYGEPGRSKSETLNLFLGDWCAQATNPPYEDEDGEVLGELGDSLARLVGTQYLAPLLAISRGLGTPLEALSVWDAIGEIARFSAALSAREARRQGETWERIGEAGLITKSAALQRYEPSAGRRRRERIAALRRKTAEEEVPSSHVDGLAATRDDSDSMGR
jgi:hypothetical protein